jgi:hypothetical protein
MIDECGLGGGMRIGRGNQSIWKTCPSDTLFTTNPTLTDLGLNPGHRSGMPVTNHQNYGVADYFSVLLDELKLYKQKTLRLLTLTLKS